MNRENNLADRDLDRIHRILVSSERRYVLIYLQEITDQPSQSESTGPNPDSERAADPTLPVSTDTLAERIAVTDVTPSRSVEQYQIELHHYHLPFLAENTTVTYDSDTRRVDYTPDPDLEQFITPLDSLRSHENE